MGNYSSKEIQHEEGDNSIPVVDSNQSDVGGSHGYIANNPTNVMPGSLEEYGTDLGDDLDEVVPTVFKWEHGGRNVYITGTFNNWDMQIPMHRSGNDFSYVHNLKRGKHAFKFVVDDEWRFAPDQPTVADVEGRVSNFIDVSEFQPYIGDDAFFDKSKERKIPNDEFGHKIPDLDDYTKEPLALPPHLRHIILNKHVPSADPLALPIPQHVSLNHLYCTAIKDGMMVLGATQRYKDKFFTVVFYSTIP
jgi:5'-AMP-activated protein kinase regulatory beta subunit